MCCGGSIVDMFVCSYLIYLINLNIHKNKNFHFPGSFTVVALHFPTSALFCSQCPVSFPVVPSCSPLQTLPVPVSPLFPLKNPLL
ncbi:hypothetical protein XENTR_v10014776 [Xenopus tropicalis]|nr:hypothetical protein XENTR_v10014776 [Xenopus tropicalis]